MTRIVAETRATLRLGTADEARALGANIIGKDDAESWLGVPVLAAEQVIGVIALERLPQNAFSDADERLLSTIASNLGVALENARLFDETKRLLEETDERDGGAGDHQRDRSGAGEATRLPGDRGGRRR